MSERFAFCFCLTVCTEGKPQLLDGWCAALCVCVCVGVFFACMLSSMAVHARARSACVEEGMVVGGSKSAVIQALLLLLNDDVNL